MFIPQPFNFHCFLVIHLRNFEFSIMQLTSIVRVPQEVNFCSFRMAKSIVNTFIKIKNQIFIILA